MKIRVIGFLLLTVTLFCACQPVEEPLSHIRQTTPSTTSAVANSVDNVPAYENQTYHFDTYAELAEFMAEQYEKEEGISKLSPYCQDFVQRTAEKGIWIPYLEGEPVKLRNELEWWGITLFTSELYYRPWIWYITDIDGEFVQICTTPLEDVFADVAEELSGSELIRKLAPNAPNLHNADEKKHYHIEEKEIETVYGKRNALVKLLIEDQKEYITFSQGHMLILLRADRGVITDEWLRSFELRRYQE